MQLGNITGTIPTEQQKSVKILITLIVSGKPDRLAVCVILSSKYLKIIHDLTSEVKYGDIYPIKQFLVDSISLV